ncbi:sigma factor-like helix-turn-helix DNA-binding protein [Nonomuraea sp. NPDC052129]|uniref:sigma factor-like helix-turn-helix DNA-binding protein n=1 Tax=Nonomuraea sp. NPDC052129 TaxID=3154651 RepID=UPI003441747A
MPTESLPDTTARGDFARELSEKGALWTASRGLSDRQRAVIVLHYSEDLTLPQCAAVLGCSLGTVKTQLGRALTRLRN